MRTADRIFDMNALEGTPLETVDSYVYLGERLTIERVGINGEIKARIKLVHI